MRKGYNFEYWTKLRLEREHGKGNVLKIPFWSFVGDFLVINGIRILKIIECKSTHKKYRPSKKEKQQLKNEIEWCKSHNIPWELWLKEGKLVQYLNANDVEQKYLKEVTK
jgi:hypothetical protein